MDLGRSGTLEVLQDGVADDDTRGPVSTGGEHTAVPDGRPAGEPGSLVGSAQTPGGRE
jgi:hypothetical protein